MTNPQDPTRAALPEPLKVAAYLVTNLRSGEPSLCFEDERCDYGDEDHVPVFDPMVLLTDALSALESERQAHTAEVDGLRADARAALVIALSCIRWQSFGECRTPDHDGAPPAPDAAAKAIEAAIATLGGRGQ